MEKDSVIEKLQESPNCDPARWVDVNFDTIVGWVCKHCTASVEHEDIKHDAYIAAICAATIVNEKGMQLADDDGRFFRATFFNLMKQNLFVPRINTVPFSSVYPDDEIVDESFSMFVDVYENIPDIEENKEDEISSQLAIDVLEYYWGEITSGLKDGEKQALEASLGLSHMGALSCREAEPVIGKKKTTISADSASGVQKIIENMGKTLVTTSRETFILRKKQGSNGESKEGKVIERIHQHRLTDVIADVIDRNLK